MKRTGEVPVPPRTASEARMSRISAHRCLYSFLVAVAVASAATGAPDAPATRPAATPDATLRFTARTRHELAPKSGRFEVIEQPRTWDARQTAGIICNLWDRDWCDGATTR